MKNTITVLAYYVSFGVLLISTIFLFNGCSKADELANTLFEGFFKTSDGWEVELIGDKGVIRKQGTINNLFAKERTEGDDFIIQVSRKNENTWKGYVVDKNFEYSMYGEVSIVGNTLTISPNLETPYTLTKISGSTGGTGTGTGGTGTGNTGPEVLTEQVFSGESGTKTYFHFTVPANVKSMEIRTNETLTNGKNSNNLYVRLGSNPIANQSTGSNLTYTADCASLSINREEDFCVFTNPAGEYYVLLYDYNNFYFNVNLVVTITR